MPAAEHARIRITLTSRNAKALEKICADWIRAAKDIFRNAPMGEEMKVRRSESISSPPEHLELREWPSGPLFAALQSPISLCVSTLFFL